MPSLLISLFIFLSCSAIFLAALTPAEFNSFLNCLVLTGAAAMIARYAHHALTALKRDYPEPPQMLAVALVFIAIGIFLIRMVRIVEGPDEIAAPLIYYYLMASMIMAWGIFLGVLSPPIRLIEPQWVPYVLIWPALGSGVILFFILVFLHVVPLPLILRFS